MVCGSWKLQRGSNDYRGWYPKTVKLSSCTPWFHLSPTLDRPRRRMSPPGQLQVRRLQQSRLWRDWPVEVEQTYCVRYKFVVRRGAWQWDIRVQFCMYLIVCYQIRNMCTHAGERPFKCVKFVLHLSDYLPLIIHWMVYIYFTTEMAAIFLVL